MVFPVHICDFLWDFIIADGFILSIRTSVRDSRAFGKIVQNLPQHHTEENVADIYCEKNVYCGIKQ